ncbi:MAG: hypothetical protein AB7S48_07300 [Bacteroidales bacterium]
MKLYIPTSSLNFNNIMSCESISPHGFYLQRNFGYKTFEKVDLNSFNNSLLLFEAFPEFKISNSELVNYPMVIEVDIDVELDGLKRIQNEIWQTDRTIYLNPFNSKIYFLTPDNKRTIISRSESSAETKLVKLYWNSIFVFQSESREYNLDGIYDIQNLNYEEIEKDNQINKIKGFAYAYLIAANNAKSKESVQLANVINKTINLSSAIVNSVSGKGTQQQTDELKYLLQKITSYQYKDVKEYLRAILPDQYNNVWNEIYNNFGMRIPNRYNFESYLETFTDRAKYEISLQELKNWSNKMIENSNISKPKFEWNSIALVGNRLTQYEDSFITKLETREMYQNLINDIFVSSDITESSFSTERSRLADEITRKIKSYVGEEEWKTHDANKYLNSLRRNIAGQEAFNIQWNTGLISAIASFLLKGDDFEKLTDFLILSEIEDGRLAFGFYGSICGFANLSRVFTAGLFESDIDYLSKIYKTLFKQIHNIELIGILPKEEKPKSILVETKVNKDGKNEDISNNVISILIQDIEINVSDFSILKEKDKKYYKTEMTRLYRGDISDDYIKALERIEPPKGTIGKWKAVIAYLKTKSNRTIDEEITQKPIPKQTSMLFDDNENQLFIYDYSAFDKISSFIPKNELKKVKTEIEWIQKVHRENGYKRKDGSLVKLDKHSNEDLINHLKNNATSSSKISPNTIDIMIKELKRIYCH